MQSPAPGSWFQNIRMENIQNSHFSASKQKFLEPEGSQSDIILFILSQLPLNQHFPSYFFFLFHLLFYQTLDYFWWGTVNSFMSSNEDVIDTASISWIITDWMSWLFSKKKLFLPYSLYKQDITSVVNWVNIIIIFLKVWLKESMCSC